MSFPPIPVEAPDRDADQLGLLAIFHYIYAGLSVLGLIFLGLHYTMMRMVFTSPQVIEQMRHPQNGPPPPFDPASFFQIFVWFYVFFGALIVTMMILNLAAGVKLQARRSRMFIMVVGALNCLGFPLGTVLGVFTLVVVQRDSVRMKFEANEAAARA